MKRIEEAKKILQSLGLPSPQCNEISAITFLALANIGKDMPWVEAEPIRLRIHDILAFAKSKLRRTYAENTRETIRRQVIHQFEQAGIVERNPESPGLATNSPRTCYALRGEVIELSRAFGTESWSAGLSAFLSKRSTLIEVYSKKRAAQMIPVKVSPSKQLTLSPGKHNELQVAVVKQFAPRFAPGAELLYLGDAAKKLLHLNEDLMGELGVLVTEHDKLPDVVLYHRETDRLFLIEAVTSHGPVSPKRQYELEQILASVTAKRVYVSAFPSLKEFKEHIGNIAWETEVWVSDMPDHLIHFNGDRYLP